MLRFSCFNVGRFDSGKLMEDAMVGFVSEWKFVTNYMFGKIFFLLSICRILNENERYRYNLKKLFRLTAKYNIVECMPLHLLLIFPLFPKKF